MKRVTVREAQHNLAKILRVVESGEEIEIVRRNLPVARLSPVESPDRDEIDWSGHEDRLAAVWGDRMVESVDEALDELRGLR